VLDLPMWNTRLRRTVIVTMNSAPVLALVAAEQAADRRAAAARNRAVRAASPGPLGRLADRIRGRRPSARSPRRLRPRPSG
jgi:hypothetical protein